MILEFVTSSCYQSMKNLQVYFLSIFLAHISKSHIVCIYILFFLENIFNNLEFYLIIFLVFFHLFQSENTQQENY